MWRATTRATLAPARSMMAPTVMEAEGQSRYWRPISRAAISWLVSGQRVSLRLRRTLVLQKKRLPRGLFEVAKAAPSPRHDFQLPGSGPARKLSVGIDLTDDPCALR